MFLDVFRFYLYLLGYIYIHTHPIFTYISIYMLHIPLFFHIYILYMDISLYMCTMAKYKNIIGFARLIGHRCFVYQFPSKGASASMGSREQRRLWCAWQHSWSWFWGWRHGGSGTSSRGRRAWTAARAAARNLTTMTWRKSEVFWTDGRDGAHYTSTRDNSATFF